MDRHSTVLDMPLSSPMSSAHITSPSLASARLTGPETERQSPGTIATSGVARTIDEAFSALPWPYPLASEGH